MTVTASSLYRETGNFFRHQFTPIILLCLFIALLTTLITHTVATEEQEIIAISQQLENQSSDGLFQQLNSMTEEQKAAFVQEVKDPVITVLIAQLLSLLVISLFNTGLISLISCISAGKPVNTWYVATTALRMLPRMFILCFLVSLLTYLGLLIFIIPGIALMLLLSLSGVILMTEKCGVIAALRASLKTAWSHFALIWPTLPLWLATLIVIPLLLGYLLNALNADLSQFIINTVSYLISSVLTIYLYRLYMLIR